MNPNPNPEPEPEFVVGGVKTCAPFFEDVDEPNPALSAFTSGFLTDLGVSDVDVKKLMGQGVIKAYNPDQPRDERGRFGSGGAADIHVASQQELAMLHDAASSSPGYLAGDPRSKDGAASQMILAGVGEASTTKFVASDPKYGPVGLLTTMGDYKGNIYVSHLAVHPDVALGKIPIKGVGTSLMQHAASLAASDGKGVSLISLNSSSDKFYEAIGMTDASEEHIGDYHWTPAQCVAISEYSRQGVGVHKQDDDVRPSVDRVAEWLNAARNIEEEIVPPTAGLTEE